MPHRKPTILLSGMPVALASQVRAPTISSLDGLPTCVIVCVAACAQTNGTGLGVGGSMQGAHSEGRGDSARVETGTSQSKLGVQSARCAIHAGWGLTNLIARHVQRLHGGRDGVCSSKPAGVVEWLAWLAATAHCKGLGCARRFIVQLQSQTLPSNCAASAFPAYLRTSGADVERGGDGAVVPLLQPAQDPPHEPIRERADGIVPCDCRARHSNVDGATA